MNGEYADLLLVVRRLYTFYTNHDPINVKIGGCDMAKISLVDPPFFVEKMVAALIVI